MKKLMIAVAAVACATVGFAEDITSENVVGYHSVEIFNGQMNLLNAPWSTIVNENGKVELQNCMSRDGLVSMTSSYDFGDYIYTWDFSLGTWGETYYYVNLPDDLGPDYADCWCYMDGDPYPSVVELDPGAAFWIYHAGSSGGKLTLTFNGQVATGAQALTLVGQTMSLCGNPYPVALDLNKSAGQVTITGATSMQSDYTFGDYIYTWDFSLGTWGETYYYVNLPDDLGPDYADCWCYMDGDPYPAKTEIPVGSGFWYYPADASGVTLQFTNPIK